MKPHSQQFLQKRKFYMVLPLLALPFITITFWVLGGGQGSTVQAKAMDSVGLNYKLPDAHFNEREVWDKLSLYEMAERDSAKFEEARESDPYFDLIAFQTEQDTNKKANEPKDDKLISGFKQKQKQVSDPNEERVNRKLQELINEINKPAQSTVEPKQIETQIPSDPQFTEDVNRLESLMGTMQSSPESDHEMEQIEGVLEKILDIQHPARVKEKLALQNQLSKSQALTVETASKEDNISMIKRTDSNPSVKTDSVDFEQVFSVARTSNGFYGLDDEGAKEQVKDNSITAVIHDTQEVVAGSTVKMRLLNDIHINGRLVPKGQLIYGVCAINGERLTIEINSIRTENSLLPIALSVYDLDGLEGIYIPGAIARDAAKQASGNALQNVQLMSLDPSFGAQAAAAGVEAAKGLFTKKAKLIKVTVKAGYHILLKDTSPSSQMNF